MPKRATAATLCAAVLLASTGMIALVFQPQGVSAGVTPGVAPDFVVGPGDTAPKTFSKALHGSAEVKGEPDECRHDAVIGLSCAAHRIKVNRSDPSYQLSIILEWDAQGEPTVIQAPDIDMYLFTEPTGKLDSSDVGGAGATMPEQIKITPGISEYDLVVQAYAGSITSYKLTVSYTNTATIKAGEVTPDFVLSPDQPPVVAEFDTVLVGQPGAAVFPAGCRGPDFDYVCDVYRVKLNRSRADDAMNFVVFALDWTPQGHLPDLALVAAGLVSRPLPDLNLYVYDAPEHSLDGVGGAKVEDVPERGGWEAKQDEYDIVVQSAVGIGTNYTLTLYMSDEVFDKPFEFLDPVTGEVMRQEPDGSFVPTGDGPTGGAVAIPTLGLAPIDADDQIAGIGLGTTEQFDNEDLLALGRSAMRNTAATTKPPAAWILWLAMVVLPIGSGLFGVAIMRRRHTEAF